MIHRIALRPPARRHAVLPLASAFRPRNAAEPAPSTPKRRDTPRLMPEVAATLASLALDGGVVIRRDAAQARHSCRRRQTSSTASCAPRSPRAPRSAHSRDRRPGRARAGAWSATRPVLHGHQRQHAFERAGRTEQVAVHGLGGADRDVLGVRAEHGPDRRGLGRIVGHRTGPVGVDRVDLLGRETGAPRAALIAAAWPSTPGRVMCAGVGGRP